MWVIHICIDCDTQNCKFQAYVPAPVQVKKNHAHITYPYHAVQPSTYTDTLNSVTIEHAQPLNHSYHRAWIQALLMRLKES